MDRYARYIAIGLVSLTALLIVGVAALRVFSLKNPHVEVDRAKYPVCGIDISAHNGRVDFRRAAAEGGVRFAYLKATEGATFKDSAFHANYDSAREARLQVGAYHFFRFDIEGGAQADNLVEALNGRLLDLPVAIDVEEWGNPAQVPTELIVERLQAMRAKLLAAGIPSLIYTNKNGYSRFVRKNIPDAEIWICSFTNPPISSATPWRLWQHSHMGTVPGIAGEVDLNTFNGSVLDYKLWLQEINGSGPGS